MTTAYARLGIVQSSPPRGQRRRPSGPGTKGLRSPPHERLLGIHRQFIAQRYRRGRPAVAAKACTAIPVLRLPGSSCGPSSAVKRVSRWGAHGVTRKASDPCGRPAWVRSRAADRCHHPAVLICFSAMLICTARPILRIWANVLTAERWRRWARSMRFWWNSLCAIVSLSMFWA